MEKLRKIQAELKAPKNQRNDHFKYNYRSCEDILEALKPLLLEHGCTLIVTDCIKEIGSVVYVESTAKIMDADTDKTIQVTAQAGIDTTPKNRDISQSFGSASSYSRKYALNGLFLIDDTKDADAQKPLKVDKKPKASQVAIDKAKELILKGEEDVIKNMKSSMSLSKKQLDELEAFEAELIDNENDFISDSNELDLP